MLALCVFLVLLTAGQSLTTLYIERAPRWSLRAFTMDTDTPKLQLTSSYNPIFRVTKLYNATTKSFICKYKHKPHWFTKELNIITKVRHLREDLAWSMSDIYNITASNIQKSYSRLKKHWKISDFASMMEIESLQAPFYAISVLMRNRTRKGERYFRGSSKISLLESDPSTLDQLRLQKREVSNIAYDAIPELYSKLPIVTPLPNNSPPLSEAPSPLPALARYLFRISNNFRFIEIESGTVHARISLVPRRPDMNVFYGHGNGGVGIGRFVYKLEILEPGYWPVWMYMTVFGPWIRWNLNKR